MSKRFNEIYRGYEIDYDPDNVSHDSDPDKNVFILKDGERVATTTGVEAAYDWVDKTKRAS